MRKEIKNWFKDNFSYLVLIFLFGSLVGFIYEELFLDEILNLKKDVVIALANKFSIRISGYNVYYYDEKIIPTFDKFLKEKIGYKEMHSLNTNF